METWVLVIIAIIGIIYFVHLDNESCDISTKSTPPKANIDTMVDNQEYEIPDVMFPEFKSRLDKNTVDKSEKMQFIRPVKKYSTQPVDPSINEIIKMSPTNTAKLYT